MDKSILEKEEALFFEWENDRDRFSRDGIIDIDKYIESDPKIMFILKETNSKKGEPVDLKEFLSNGANERKPSWDNIARWIYGIKNLEDKVVWETLENREYLNELRNVLLPTICVINLKKSSGGHTTNPKELRNIADQDKSLLSRQFQLYFENQTTRPDFIICGGSSTSKSFNNLVDLRRENEWSTTSRGISYYMYDTGRYFIKYVHPEARVKDCLLYYGLIDAIKELKSK